MFYGLLSYIIYRQVVGRPAIPPYWALGLHLGREDFNDVATMQAMVDRNEAAGIPFVSSLRNFLCMVYLIIIMQNHALTYMMIYTIDMINIH